MDAVVPNTTNHAVLDASVNPIHSLTISSGGVVDDSANNATFTVDGNWTNNGGTFTPGTGTVSFSGSAAQTIGGSTVTTFDNLTINNAAGVTNSVAGTTVSGAGTLTLTSGTFTLSSGLTLGAGATISRSGGSLSAAPTFGTSVNVTYPGSTALTTGPEIPTSTSVLNNLTIGDSAGVTLNAAATVNGALTLTAGTLDIHGNALTTANVTGTTTVTDSAATATFTVNDTSADSFGGTLTGALREQGGRWDAHSLWANSFTGGTTQSAGRYSWAAPALWAPRLLPWP